MEIRRRGAVRIKRKNAHTSGHYRDVRNELNTTMITRQSAHARAFTLIELLVVIAIISMLASIVLVSINGARSKGRDSKRIQDLREVRNAIELYRSNNGSYPVGSCISSPWWNCWGSAGEPRLVSSTYLATMPQDPSFADIGGACSRPSDGSRLYGYWSDGTQYVLVTNLENPVPTSDLHYYTGTYGCTSFGNWYMASWL